MATSNESLISLDLRILAVAALVIAISLFTPDESNGEALRDRFVADHRNFFRLLWSDRPDLSVNYLFQPENDEDGGPGSFDLQLLRVRSEFAFPTEPDFFFRFGGDYDYRAYDFKEVRGARTATSSELLHRIVLKIGAGSFINDNLLLTGQYRPGIYSDLDDGISDDDIRHFGDGLLAYRLNPGAQLVGGVAYDETFDDAPLYPLIGFRMRSESGQFGISLTFPVEAKISYSFDTKLQAYGGYWISGDSYRINQSSGSFGFDTQIQDRHLGVGLNYWFSSSVNLNAELGASLGSRLEFKAASAGQFADELDPTGYLTVGVGVSL